MLFKFVLILMFCLNSFSEASDTTDLEFVTITTIAQEDETTKDPMAILQELKNEQLAIQNKQLNNSTNVVASNTTSVTSSVTTAVSNVYNRFPCACLKGQCGCCTGSLLDSFNQKACLNVTYEPDDFAFNAALSLNGHVFYKNRISGKNPPPICLRLPRIRVIRLCARFSNVYFTGPNMHACVGMEADWNDFTLFNSLFNCFRIGAAGVSLVSPEDGGGINTNIDEDEDDGDDDDDDEDYDDSARGFHVSRFQNKLK